jgi:flavin-binding protein dodecin
MSGVCLPCWTKGRKAKAKQIRALTSAEAFNGQRSAVMDRLGKVADSRLCSAQALSKVPLMSEHVYKKIELVGSSTTSFDDAVKNAVALASKTIRNMRWFEVVETRGQIEDNQINHWQVTVKIGFTLDR